MPFEAIVSAFSGLKSASGLLKDFNKLKTESEVAAKTIELNHIISSVQDDLFATQSAYSTAIGRINELEKELVAMKNWATEKKRYKLHQIAPGSFVYRLKPKKQKGEPVHDLCPQCYDQGIKSILQFGGFHGSNSKYVCNRCGTAVLGARADNLSVETVPGKSRRWE